MTFLKKLSAFSIPFLLPSLAFADDVCHGANTSLCNPLGYTSLTQFLQKLLQIVAEIGFPVIVLFLVYIGFLFIAAEGNPKKLASARSYLFWAVIGGLIVLGAQALSLAIQGTVDQLKAGTGL